MDGHHSTARFGKRPVYVLALLLVIYTCNFVDRMIIGVVAEPIKQELGVADWQIGLLGGLAFAVFYAGLGIPLARLAERYNRVTFISCCLVIWSGMTILCGAVLNFGQLLAARVGVGVGEAGCTPAAQSLICDMFPAERRPLALSIFTLGVPLGLLIGASVGGWIAQHLGWREAFFIVGLPGLLLALVAKTTLSEPERGRFDPVGLIASEPPPFLAVVQTLAGNATTRNVIIGITLCSMGNYAAQTFGVPFLLRGFNLSLTEASSGFGLATGISGMIGLTAGGWFGQRLSARDRRALVFIPAVGLILGAPLAAAAYLQSDLRSLTFLYFLSAVCFGFVPGPSYAIITNSVSSQMRATAIAVLLLIMNLVGMGIGPLLVGIVSDMVTSLYLGPDAIDLCRGGSIALPECTKASFVGLQAALVLSTLGLAWSAVHFLLAARALRSGGDWFAAPRAKA